MPGISAARLSSRTLRFSRLMFATTLAVAIVFSSAIVQPAEAGRRTRGVVTGIGVGVAAAVLLNELSKGSTKKSYSSRSKTEGKSRYSSTGSKKAKRDYSESSKASKGSKSSSKSSSKYVSKSTSKSGSESAHTSRTQDEEDTVEETGSVTPPDKETGDDADKVAAKTSVAGAISTPEEIKSAQQHLKYMGYDIPEASGTLDEKTRTATIQFQTSISEPATGELTPEQLQMLFIKVAGQGAKE